MRITVNKYSDDYIGAENIGRYSVLLDGEVVKDCIMADDELGVVEYYKRGDDGQFLINRPQGWEPEVVTEEAHGSVEIVDLWACCLHPGRSS